MTKDESAPSQAGDASLHGEVSGYQAGLVLLELLRLLPQVLGLQLGVIGQ